MRQTPQIIKFKYLLTIIYLVIRVKNGLMVLGLMGIVVLSVFAGGDDGAPLT